MLQWLGDGKIEGWQDAHTHAVRKRHWQSTAVCLTWKGSLCVLVESVTMSCTLLVSMCFYPFCFHNLLQWVQYRKGAFGESTETAQAARGLWPVRYGEHACMHMYLRVILTHTISDIELEWICSIYMHSNNIIAVCIYDTCVWALTLSICLMLAEVRTYVIITVGNEHGGLHNVWHYAAASGMLQMCPISLVGSVVSGYHQEATPSGTAHSLKARLWIASNTVNPLRDRVLTAGLCADTLYSREDCIVVNFVM